MEEEEEAGLKLSFFVCALVFWVRQCYAHGVGSDYITGQLRAAEHILPGPKTENGFASSSSFLLFKIPQIV